MFDQSAALAAHARLCALEKRTYKGAKEPDADELPLQAVGKQHLCGVCGATDPVQFDGRNKSTCTKCRTKRRLHALKSRAGVIAKRARTK